MGKIISIVVSVVIGGLLAAGAVLLRGRWKLVRYRAVA